MSADVDTLRRMYAAFNSRDLDAFLDCLHAEVEARPLIGSVEGRVYRGHGGARRWMTEVLPEVWGTLEAHPEEFIEAGDVHVVLVRNVGRGAASGARVEQRVAHLVRMRQGRIAELTSYPDRAEAFRAAGVAHDAAR